MCQIKVCFHKEGSKVPAFPSMQCCVCSLGWLRMWGFFFQEKTLHNFQHMCFKRLKLQMCSSMWPEKPKHSTFNVHRLITRHRPHNSLHSSSCSPHPPPHSYLPVDLRVLLPWLPMSNGSSPFENHHSSPFTHMRAYAGVHMLSVWGNGSHPSHGWLVIVRLLLSVPSKNNRSPPPTTATMLFSPESTETYLRIKGASPPPSSTYTKTEDRPLSSGPFICRNNPIQ